MAAIAALPATVCGQHLDILLQNVGDRLSTGAGDAESGENSLGDRVFIGRFDSLYAVNSPGFNSVGAGGGTMPPGADALPGNTDIWWDFLPMRSDGVSSNLMYWSGAGAVDFGLTPSPAYSLSLIGKSGATAAADGTSNIVTGAVLDTTASTGFLHRHRYFFLDDDEDPDDQTEASPGVYLISLRFRMDGLDASDPAYIVWGTPGVGSAVLQSAKNWVTERQDLLSPVFQADFDGDYDVDGADFLAWQRNLGQTSARQAHGDANRDRLVSGGDLPIWRDQMGYALEDYPGGAIPATASSATVVPEPATAVLLSTTLGAIIGGTSLRKRRMLNRGIFIKLAKAPE